MSGFLFYRILVSSFYWLPVSFRCFPDVRPLGFHKNILLGYSVLNKHETTSPMSALRIMATLFLYPPVFLSSNLSNPQPEGTMVTFTAEVTGGSGNYEYKYYLCSPDGQWAMVQDYSSSPNYTWNTTGFVGTSYLQVWVRNAGSSDRYQVFDSIGYEIE